MNLWQRWGSCRGLQGQGLLQGAAYIHSSASTRVPLASLARHSTALCCSPPLHLSEHCRAPGQLRPCAHLQSTDLPLPHPAHPSCPLHPPTPNATLSAAPTHTHAQMWPGPPTLRPAPSLRPRTQLHNPPEHPTALHEHPTSSLGVTKTQQNLWGS